MGDCDWSRARIRFGLKGGDWEDSLVAVAAMIVMRCNRKLRYAMRSDLSNYAFPLLSHNSKVKVKINVPVPYNPAIQRRRLCVIDAPLLILDWALLKWELFDPK
uniref:Uncharacterized protein n=1 Tax=Pseudo-nitzschia australis TaxID=44445 RepID=A0A7S4AN73_9STRA|mmetsp:Transcript_6772/g.14423  ORF Transcript_6772/g.14423 Transcript_6772/m.14423 type:complete len:104 (-) Transcript_6772:151-462(-)